MTAIETKSKRLPNVLPVRLAQRHLDEIFRRVIENNERFVITLRRKAAAIIISVDEYRRLSAKSKSIRRATLTAQVRRVANAGVSI
jgi:PHD/YefM family antitoxin component YafN of YafNO toxin-antitoxin module